MFGSGCLGALPNAPCSRASEQPLLCALGGRGPGQSPQTPLPFHSVPCSRRDEATWAILWLQRRAGLQVMPVDQGHGTPRLLSWMPHSRADACFRCRYPLAGLECFSAPSPHCPPLMDAPGGAPACASLALARPAPALARDVVAPGREGASEDWGEPSGGIAPQGRVGAGRRSAAPVAHGGSQAGGQIRAAAAGLHHSHSNEGFKLLLLPTPQLTATLDP